MSDKALVVCPGRGTYTAQELGYLGRYGGGQAPLLGRLDALRRRAGQPALGELDAAPAFSPALHTAGEHAAALIYACSLVDFQAIDRGRYEIVAVTGNSMGWYTALGVGGALGPEAGFELVNEMAALTAAAGGGQLVYPEVDEQWRPDPARRAHIDAELAAAHAAPGCRAYDSIRFGGYRVLAGNEAGLARLMQRLPRVEGRFPLRLANHAAFHTPLMRPASERALARFPLEALAKPAVPLIDGRGRIWQPHSTDREALRRYTLEQQVVAPFDFTRALTVGLKEFAPTRLILLGPGSALGGAIAQVLIALGWRGLSSKDDFAALQDTAPYLLAMGRPDQRALVTG